MDWDNRYISDYLGAIATKSLDMAPVVQPRPVSLFEPVHTEGTFGAGDRFPKGAMNGLSDFDHDETTEMRLTTGIRPQTRLHQPMANSIMDHAVPLKPPKSIDPVPLRPQQDSDRNLQTPNEMPETIIDRRPARLSSEEMEPRRKADHDDASTTKPSRSREQARPQVKPSIERVAFDLPEAPQNARQAGMVPISRERVTPSFRMTKTMPFQSSQEPTIQVTIGRIEVRATTPPVSSTRQRPALKTMSLDEYLGKRNGGGR